MKKLLLSLATVALTGAFAMAESVTIDWTNQGYTNAQEVTGLTVAPVTVSFDKGTNSNTPKYYTSGTAIRVYAGSKVTISVTSGYKLESVKFTTGSGDKAFNSESTASNGTFTVGTATWTAPTDESVLSTTITQGGTSGHVRIVTTTITYSETGGDELAPAGLSFPEASYTVLLNEAFTAPALTKTTDAAATYTSSNEEVATVDAATGAVTVLAAGTTVIKATTPKTATYYAGEASYTLNVVSAYGSIADFYTVGENNSGVINFPLTVAYQKGQNTYAYDAAGNYTLIYGNYVGTRERGDVIPAGWEGKYTLHKGLPEIVPVNAPAASTDHVDYTPAEVESVNADMMNHVVVLKKVTFAADASTEGNTEDGTTYTFFNKFGIDPVVAGTYNVELAVSTYNNNMQLYPIKYTEWESGVDEITVAEGEAQYYNMQGVRVANPENGMFIRIQNGKAQKVVIK